ncbi:MAG TPA: hypothetical protein VLB44_13585 [Kofleriaceae bacterium]|nr:hypothetical protein [Kofleriaceae bacterium]
MSSRNSERGSAMLITMILVAAILAGAAVLVSLQLGSNRSTEVTRTGISALYCAEAGLAATRATIAANQTDWATYLGAKDADGTGTEPAWLTPISHDLDGDGNPDFKVWLEDDFDEVGTDVPTVDANSRVFIVSRCIKYVDLPREVRELVGYQQASNCYNSQRGGCAGNGNMNQ